MNGCEISNNVGHVVVERFFSAFLIVLQWHAVFRIVGYGHRKVVLRIRIRNVTECTFNSQGPIGSVFHVGPWDRRTAWCCEANDLSIFYGYMYWRGFALAKILLSELIGRDSGGSPLCEIAPVIRRRVPARWWNSPCDKQQPAECNNGGKSGDRAGEAVLHGG